jgi:hypothetical protein
MKMLNINEQADYLESAIIEKTIKAGHAIIHFGKSAGGVAFVMVNDCFTEGAALTESI